MGKILIIKSGKSVTIQDFGRFSLRKYGIPQSGAMDIDGMKDANSLVGNPLDYPIIEIPLTELQFKVLTPSVIGVGGAVDQVYINGTTAYNQAPHLLKKNDWVKILPAHCGVFTYLAIHGKMKIKKVLGSFSTYLPAKIGGLSGRAIQKNDEIETVPFNSMNDSYLSLNKPLKKNEITTIRIIKGPEWSMLKEWIANKCFTISISSNRMGIRLAGDTLSLDKAEIYSSAVIPGIIQLPPDGHPIILMKDCQTIGGYPRIAKVIDADLGKLAQLRYGSKIIFQMIDVATAQSIMNNDT